MMYYYYFVVFAAFSATYVNGYPTKNCSANYDVRLNKIILTQVSENNGAVFLHKTFADSLEDCLNICCDTLDCTVGVFGPKHIGSCFLFNCHSPNVCNFTTNTDYTVFLQRTQSGDPGEVNKVEQQPEGTLRGICGPQKRCVTENSICDSGQCVCKAGFIEKKHACVRSLCSKPEIQFQCDDGTACIAIYDVCNEIRECNDGSDEASCPEVVRPIKNTHLSASTSVEFPKLKSQKQQRSDISETSTHSDLLRDRFRHRIGEDSIVPEFELNSLKGQPIKGFMFDTDFRKSQSRNHFYPSRGEYYEAPSAAVAHYVHPFDPDFSSFVKPETRRQPAFTEEDLAAYLKTPNAFTRLHRYPQELNDDDLLLSEARESPSQASWSSRKTSRPRFASSIFEDGMEDPEDSKEVVESPRRSSGRHLKVGRRRLIRRKPKPVNKHQVFMEMGAQDSTDVEVSSDKNDLAEKSVTTPGPRFGAQNYYQWHTAAIILAVGLGLISCLFGLLAGRCCRRHHFPADGPQSKSVAASHLRRRIRQARGLSNGDIEKNSLLSRLQL